MVGAFGEVQVMDWGLAKVLPEGKVLPDGQGEIPTVISGDTAPLDDTRPTSDAADPLTRPGSMMGTPGYMAPEQAAGRWDAVGPQSDVFGLGAVLCALLTGRSPYTGTNPRVQSQSGCWSTREALARLDGCGASPDLIALCKRCLATDPADRPADGTVVAATVADLRRAAEERARRAEVDRAKAAVHTAEQRKRRQLTLVGGGVLSAVLLAGITGTAVGLVKAERARADEAVQRADAENTRDRAQDVLDAMTSDLAGDSLATQRAVSEEQKRFLTGVLAYYREFASRTAGDEPTSKRIAAAAFRVGMIEDRLGRREEAVTAFHAALQAYEKLAAESPATAEYRRELANCHNNLGNELSDLGRKGEAEGYYRESLAIRVQLSTDFPLVAEYRRERSASHNNLGLLLTASGRKPDARDQLQQALVLREKLAADFPLSADYSRELAATLTYLGNVLADMGKRADAEEYYQKALPILDWLAFAFPTVSEYRRELAVTLNNLGNVLSDLGQRPAAEEHLRRALTLREKLRSDYPAAAEYRRELAATLTNLGHLYVHLKKRPAAEEHYRRALALQEKLATDFTATPSYGVELGNTYFGFGVLLLVNGEAADSLQWFDKAVHTLSPLHEKYPRDILAKHHLRNGHRGRAEAYDRLEQFGEAVRDWDRAVELSSHEERPKHRAARAYSLVRAGEVARAIAEAAELRQMAGWTADQWYNFACVYSIASTRRTEQRQKYADQAMELLRQAVTAGWSDAAHMKVDVDLDPLRDRGDFRMLLANLEKESPPKESAQPETR
jgi:tetratricopeptide (TPR) repeat protein